MPAGRAVAGGPGRPGRACGVVSAGRRCGPIRVCQIPKGWWVGQKLLDLFRALDVPAAFHTNMQIESSQLRDHVIHHLVEQKIFNSCFPICM